MSRVLGGYYWHMGPGVVVGDYDCCYGAMRVSNDPTVTLSGVPPLTYTAKGWPLIDYTVHGAAVQAATPSPDNPVEVQAVGDKTANLINANAIVKGRLDDGVLGYGEETTELIVSGNVIKCTTAKAWRGFVTDFIPVEQGGYFLYHIATPNDITYVYRASVYDSQKNFVRVTTQSERAITINEGEAFIRVSYQLGVAGTFEISNIMFGKGKTALPYEPYGYKIPFTTAAEDGTESITTTAYIKKPLYKIGDYADTLCYAEQKVERVIKEMILTGEETYYLLAESNAKGIISFYLNIKHFVPSTTPYGWCTHFPESNDSYQSVSIESFGLGNSDRIYIRVSNSRIKTKEELTQWLKEQYANGTPVKVYYVLATPETKSVELPKLPTLSGANFLNTDTTVRPSNVTITGKGLAEITTDPVMTDLLAIMEGMDE